MERTKYIIPSRRKTSEQKFSQANLVVLSFGGGPPSVALMVLNAIGMVRPKADIVVFADPGSEHPDTYKYLIDYYKYAEGHGMKFYSVWDERRREGDLTWWVHNKSNSIPIFLKDSRAIGRRQCTVSSKMNVINRFLRNDCATETFTTQLAMTRDEIFRMKAARQRYITNIYPLVTLSISRKDCQRIIEEAGLPLPPRSACTFCPFQTLDRWVELFYNHPEEFEKAVRMEEICSKRSVEAGRGEAYLTSLMVPLPEAVKIIKKRHELGSDSDLTSMECIGNCFT